VKTVHASTGKTLRKGIEPEERAAVHEAEGSVSRAEMLRCKVRYFTQGRVLGGKSFVKQFQHEAVRSRDRAVEAACGLFAPRRVPKME